MAGGRARHQRPRRCRRPFTRRRGQRAPQRRQGLHRDLRRRAGARLRADARWHRRDLRARPPSLPPAPDAHHVAVRHARRAPPASGRSCRAAGERGGAMSEVVATEEVSDFRQRARSWIRENLPNVGRVSLSVRRAQTDEEELAEIRRGRDIQRMLFDAGLAGVCVPREYGGQWLSPAHQQALNEELAGYEFPGRQQAPTFSPCLPVLLEFGTEEQKLRHIPPILKGEQLWMQFLSEPSGGSDVAGALTSAVRDGDTWVLNGSKVWTTGAWWSDWALCLARTNWDVPKHRGLTVFALPIHQPGIEVHRIEMLNGNKEFCQEFLTDVIIPDSERIGEVDDGWTVSLRWLFHERMLYNSPLVTMPKGTTHGGATPLILAVPRAAGRLDDPVVRDLIGEARM